MKFLSLLAALIFSFSAMANSNTVDRTYIGVSDANTAKKCEVKVRAVNGKITAFLLGMEVNESDGTTSGMEIDEYNLQYKLTQIGRLDGGDVALFQHERTCMNVLCTNRSTRIHLDFNGDDLIEVKIKFSMIGTFGLGYKTYSGTCSQFKLQ